jgi:hypothetical protein
LRSPIATPDWLCPTRIFFEGMSAGSARVLQQDREIGRSVAGDDQVGEPVSVQIPDRQGHWIHRRRVFHRVKESPRGGRILQDNRHESGMRGRGVDELDGYGQIERAILIEIDRDDRER